MVGWQCDTSLQINMKAEADGQMGRQDPTADTGVYSLCVCVCVCVCVFNGIDPFSAEAH